jgi:hypothetical protein
MNILEQSGIKYFITNAKLLDKNLIKKEKLKHYVIKSRVWNKIENHELIK